MLAAFRCWRWLPLLALPTLLCGCILFRDVETPEVELVGISRAGGNLLQQQLRLDLNVRNPNDFELNVRGLEFDVTLAGRHFAHGVSDAEVTLPALGEARIPVEIRATLLDLIGQALGALSSEDAIPYAIEGHVQLGGLFVPRLPFERKGEIAGRDPAGRGR